MRILFFFSILIVSCFSTDHELSDQIGQGEYDRLMNMTLHEFDQNSEGWRKYSRKGHLASSLIEQYIKTKKLKQQEARNLYWHAGQIYAMDGHYKKATSNMKKSYSDKYPHWNYYVQGSIAFLEKDKEGLVQAVDSLRNQDNPMNIEFLIKFQENWEQTYREAYNAD